MPTFFNKLTLTEAQLSRWDWAVAEYERVQQSNIDPLQVRFPNHFNFNVNYEKSALFSRLLIEGLPALKYAPPTSFSYPWYQLIDNDAPQPILFCNIYTRVSAIHGLPVTQLCMSVDQCLWSIDAMNDAAIALSEMSINLANDHQHLIRSKLMSIYANQPEFIVSYGEYHHYRIFIGRSESICQRGYAEDSLLRNADDSLPAKNDPMDVRDLYLNLMIGKTNSLSEHPEKTLLKSQKKLEQLKLSHPGQSFPSEEFIIRCKSENLESESLAYGNRPNSKDFVEISYDAWMIEKVKDFV